MVACFSFTSCNKKCTCNIEGQEVEYKIDELNDYLKATATEMEGTFKEVKKCSDKIVFTIDGETYDATDDLKCE